MQAPKCKQCGSFHWPREGHKWKEAVYQTLTPDPVATNVMSGHREGGLVGRDVEIAPFPKPEKGPGFDRLAYQREYMRKRRAKKGGGDE